MNHSTVVKQITFPRGVIALAEEKINRLGIGLPEYIRHLVINDTLPTIRLTKQEEKDFLEGIEDYKAGRTVKVHTKEELDNFFKKITPNGNKLRR